MSFFRSSYEFLHVKNTIFCCNAEMRLNLIEINKLLEYGQYLDWKNRKFGQRKIFWKKNCVKKTSGKILMES